MADNFTITGQKQNVQISPTGTGFEDVWDITYKVTDGPSKGTSATLVVPDADHNAAYINKAITAKIAALDEVANL